MNYKPLQISIPIIKNHLRLIKNWVIFEENKIGIVLLLTAIFVTILPFSNYFSNQSSINSQFGSIFLTLFLPIFCASKYISFLTKEDSLLFVMYDKITLLKAKQLIISFFILSIFLLLLSFGVIPHLLQIPIPLLITTEIIILLFIGWVLPVYSVKLNFKFKVLKANPYWNYQISNVNLLPIRGILLRELISLWRENKKSIIRIIINVSLFNIALMFFIVNNDLKEFFVQGLFLQSIVFLTFVVNYPTLNNIVLMKEMFGKELYILFGEFIFWFSLFLIYLLIVASIYSLILSDFSLYSIVFPILFFAIFLFYVLLVRIAYAEEQYSRTLIIILIIFPITIPFYIYKSYKRLK